VFRFELIRTARDPRLFWARAGYAVALLVGFLLLAPDTLDGPQVTRFAADFTFAALVVQLWAVFLITPALVGGALAEDRHRRTLDFLLTTDLTSLEIVLGKTAARLANLGLVLLAALPFFALLQLVRGIEGDLVLAVFAVSGLAALGAGGLSVWCSMRARTPAGAIFLAYLVAAAYLGLCGFGPAVLGQLSAALGAAGLDLDVTTLQEALAAANPFGIPGEIAAAARRGDVAVTLGGIVRRFAALYGLTAVVCVAWAGWRLRGLAAAGETPHGARAAVRRPAVADSPVLWKEIHFGRPLDRGWRRAVLLAAVAISLTPVPLALLASPGKSGVTSLPDGPAGAINLWVRGMTALVASLALIGVTVRAAGSVVGERERQTLDGLLLAGLTPGAILLGKWAGSVLSSRWAWAWLAVVWAVGVAGGGLHPLAVPLLAVLMAGYLGTFAAMGLVASVGLPSTFRATAVALGGLLIFSLTACAGPPLVLFAYAFSGQGPTELVAVGDDRGRVLLLLLLRLGLASWFFWIALGRAFWDSALREFEGDSEPRRVADGPPGG
jgi:ABC-type transport system involved in multi-copper enzyme maturation permease subunit